MLKNDRESIQDHEILHKLQTLQNLYMQQLLGDCFVDIQDLASRNTSNSFANEAHLSSTHSKESFITQMPLTNKAQELQTNSSQNLQASIHFLEQKILHCKLCSLSKHVKDYERFSGFVPSIFLSSHDTTKVIPKIAFIVESLHLRQPSNKHGVITSSIEDLQLNRSNEMLLDIIQRVFELHKTQAFIFPLFKCVEVGDNQFINAQIRMNDLLYERRICREYLLVQLEYVDYAIFFGEHLCKDFFESSCSETSGKLLEYYTPNNKKVVCVCVPDIMQMIVNPSLKKEAMINFTLLKNAIKAHHKS